MRSSVKVELVERPTEFDLGQAEVQRLTDAYGQWFLGQAGIEPSSEEGLEYLRWLETATRLATQAPNRDLCIQISYQD